MTSFPHLFPKKPPPTKPGPYCHIVRMDMPDHGLGKRLDDMLAFAREHSEKMPQATAKKGDNRYGYLLFGFSDRDTAAKFAAQFGGELLPE